MKAILSIGLLLAGLPSIAGNTDAAADNPTQWVADSDPAHWRINRSNRKDSEDRFIWVATDDNAGGYEELVELRRNGRSLVVLQSLKYDGNISVLTQENYTAVSRDGERKFYRDGHWVD
jgi:hypothetical protein